jgi:hypothetical protein
VPGNETTPVLATDLIEMLRARYPADAYAMLEEVRDRAGFSARGSADAIIMGLWPSRGLLFEGFELKVNRYDWIRETRKPQKAEGWFKYCDRWWLVASSESIVADGELPDPWGLLVAEPRRNNPTRLRTVKEAPRLEPEPLDRHQIAALLKRAHTMRIEVAEKQLRAAREEGKQSAIQYGEQALLYCQDELDRLKKRVEEFEAASGVDIRHYAPAAEIGAAVRAVLEGNNASGLRHLRVIRENLAGVMEKLDAALEAAS